MDAATAMQIGWGLLGGVLSSLVFCGLLTLKLFRLQFAVAALKDALLSLRNVNANRTRSDKKQEMEEFMKNMERTPRERFANDPQPWG